VLEEFNLKGNEPLYLGMIIGRAMKLATEGSLVASSMQLTKDIGTCHAFACPLKLQELAEANDKDFLHDVRGIHRLLNRRLKRLDEDFWPIHAAVERFSKAEYLLKDLVEHIDSETCQHEETHRGGAIWEICDGCGKKWADDEGGKPEFKHAPPVAAAIAYLDKRRRG